ncbi:MAG: TetR/AcrR family transcriptional regulator [Pseudomonadota bacterium]
MKIDNSSAPKSFRVSKQSVVDAAIRCFERYGPSRTSMNDIAEEADISRKTLYRMFEERPALIRCVLSQIYISMGKKIEKRLSQLKDIRDAFIEGSISTLHIVLNDTLLNEIVRAETDLRVEQFLLMDISEIRTELHRVWSPIISKGKKEGSVRSNLSDDRILEMLQGAQTLLSLRQDDSRETQRSFLDDFLWRALSNCDVGSAHK